MIDIFNPLGGLFPWLSTEDESSTPGGGDGGDGGGGDVGIIARVVVLSNISGQTISVNISIIDPDLAEPLSDIQPLVQGSINIPAHTSLIVETERFNLGQLYNLANIGVLEWQEL